MLPSSISILATQKGERKCKSTPFLNSSCAQLVQTFWMTYILVYLVFSYFLCFIQDIYWHYFSCWRLSQNTTSNWVWRNSWWRVHPLRSAEWWLALLSKYWCQQMHLLWPELPPLVAAEHLHLPGGQCGHRLAWGSAWLSQSLCWSRYTRMFLDIWKISKLKFWLI